MPNWLQRIAKGQMELNNETPNSAVIDAVMSDDKNKDEAVKAAIQRDAEIDKRNAGILATAMSSMFPVLDFSKYGFLKGLAKVGIETATGATGGYLGNRGGKYLDDKLGTSFLQGIGSFTGGLAGYGLGTKVPGIIDSAIIRKNLLTGKLEFVGPKTYSGYHQSNVYFENPTFPTNRWDVINHNADPNGFFLTLGRPAKGGFLAKRPYTLQFTVGSNKGLVQHGEIKGFLGNKNSIRNKIVKYARKNGADVVHFDGIKDNTLPDQQILFATDKSGIKFNNSYPIKYNSEGLSENLNIVSKDIISDINTGKQDALNFLSSTVKKETDAHNKALAERLGYKIVQTPERARIPMEKNGNPFPGGIRIGNDTDGLYIANKIGNSDAFGTTLVVSNKPSWDEMYIATKGRPRQTAFHEYLHRGDIGGSANGENLDTKSFFDWKSKKILNPETYNNLTYLNQPGEAAANILEIGNTLNIPIGAKYPGKKEFYGIVENALSKNDPKLNLLQYYNWKNKPKRVWEGLTGKYFTLPILAAGGAYESKD